MRCIACIYKDGQQSWKGVIMYLNLFSWLVSTKRGSFIHSSIYKENELITETRWSKYILYTISKLQKNIFNRVRTQVPFPGSFLRKFINIYIYENSWIYCLNEFINIYTKYINMSSTITSLKTASLTRWAFLISKSRKCLCP